MKKYYIFGASKLGEAAYGVLNNQYLIVGFLDNDARKHNTVFCGKEIYSPEEVLDVNSHIIIASQYYKEIEQQLKEKGIKSYKIFKANVEDVYVEFSSKKYWEERYKKGGDSGIGSYKHLADFKAKIINQFIASQKIEQICEWGVGDGNQLSLMDYPNYTGYDVSEEAIGICNHKFRNDQSKTFIHYNGERIDFSEQEKFELSLSLDVIYHLVEDDAYEAYMSNLFESSSRYVCIYSSNFNNHPTPHVKNREFLTHIYSRMDDWRLINCIQNEYAPTKNKNNNLECSESNFYFFEKIK